MSPHVRPLAGFRNMADQQLVTTASAVVKEMTDNANFPNPPVDLKTLATAVDDLSAAVAAQVQGGTASTAHKQNKRATVVDLVPGTTYVFRVRAAGTTGYSDWSDPVAHMAT